MPEHKQRKRRGWSWELRVDFEFLGDYAKSSLSGAGDMIARSINALSVVGIALIALLAYIFDLDFESVAVSFVAFVILVLATHYGSFVAYQAERRRVDDLEKELDKRARVEAHCAYPIYHKEEVGAFILVPALNVINKTDRVVDCELILTVEPTNDLPSNLPLESDALANARTRLPGTLKGNRQLMEPIRIGAESREVGFAAFRVDEIQMPDDLDPEWSNVKRMTLKVWDAINHVQLLEHEIWPAMWLELREPDAGLKVGDQIFIPLPPRDDPTTQAQQSTPDKVAFLPRRVS